MTMVELLVPFAIALGLAVAAGYGMSRPKCPTWVSVIVLVLSGATILQTLREIDSRDHWSITLLDAWNLIFFGSLLLAVVVAWFVRPARRDRPTRETRE